jgi:hypothetical protein
MATAKNGTIGILYLERVPKLKVDTPTANAYMIVNEIQKATSGFLICFIN